MPETKRGRTHAPFTCRSQAPITSRAAPIFSLIGNHCWNAACKDAVTLTSMSREKLIALFLVRLMQSRMWRLSPWAWHCPDHTNGLLALERQSYALVQPHNEALIYETIF